MTFHGRRSQRMFWMVSLALIALPVGALAQSSAAPVLTALNFAPTAINTGGASATVTVNFTSTDNFAPIFYFETAFVDPSGVFAQRALGGWRMSFSRTHPAVRCFSIPLASLLLAFRQLFR